MVCGIYKLIFNGTDKIYIGQSVNCTARLSRHIREMRAGINSKKLNEAFNLYGVPTMLIIKEVSIAELNSTENYYISQYNCVETGFNTAKQAGGGCSLSGDSHPLATISNAQVLLIIQYMLDNPTSTLKQSSEALSVSISIISHIFKQDRHVWVSKEHPELWEELSALRIYKSRGESKGASKHTNKDILTVFDILIDCPDISYKEISEFSGVSLDTINALAKGTSFKWLKDEYPDRYVQLMALKGTRSRHKEVGNRISIASKNMNYPDIVSPEGTIYTVSNISAFAREFNLDKSSLHKLLQGGQKIHKGWKTCPKEQVS